MTHTQKLTMVAIGVGVFVVSVFVGWALWGALVGPGLSTNELHRSFFDFLKILGLSGALGLTASLVYRSNILQRSRRD